MASPKGYGESDLRKIASAIPDVYAAARSGATEHDFLTMRISADPQERLVGETYHQLFRSSPSNDPLQSDFVDGRLQVNSGNHRIRAAQAVGVPFVPVWVGAPDERTLARVESACADRISAQHGNDHLAAHNALVGEHMTQEHLALRERNLEASHERDWAQPDRER
jgi:hypothetical protein